MQGMNYVEWAQEYYAEALRVQAVMDRKKERLKGSRSLSADQRKQLLDEIRRYRRIYCELIEIGATLLSRAEGAVREA